MEQTVTLIILGIAGLGVVTAYVVAGSTLGRILHRGEGPVTKPSAWRFLYPVNAGKPVPAINVYLFLDNVAAIGALHV